MTLWTGIKTTMRVMEPIAEIASGAITFLAATGGLSRHTDGKWQVDHARVKELIPRIGGLGRNDEANAAFAATMVDLENRSVMESRIARLRPEDRKVLILTVATIPDKDDRTKLLNNLALLKEAPFRAAINNWRLMQIDTDLLVRIRTGIADYGGRAWDWLQDVDNWRWLRDQARDLIVAADATMNAAAIRVETFNQDRINELTATRDARRTPWNRLCRAIGIGGID